MRGSSWPARRRALLGAQRVGRIGKGVTLERDLAQAEVAVVAERVGQTPQDVGDGLPGIIHAGSAGSPSAPAALVGGVGGGGGGGGSGRANAGTTATAP